MPFTFSNAIEIVGWSTVVTGLGLLIWKLSALQTAVQDIMVNHLPHILTEIGAMRGDISNLWQAKKDK